MSNLINKKDIIFSFICGLLSGFFLILIIKNPEINEFRKLAEFGNFIWLLPFILAFLFTLGIIGAGIIFRSFKTIFQFSKFAESGVLNTFIDMGILNGLMWFSGITSGGSIALFNVFSFSCATVNSYFWNKFWTFERKDKVNGKEFLTFFTVTMIGMGINTLILFLGTTFIEPAFGLSSGLWANLVKILATFVSMIWNFVGYKFIIFKNLVLSQKSDCFLSINLCL